MAIRDRITQFVTYLVKQIKCSQGGILIGRVTGEGKAQEITVGSGLTLSGTTLTVTGGTFAAASHTHVSSSITDAVSDATVEGSEGKLLKTANDGSLSLSFVFADSAQASEMTVGSVGTNGVLWILGNGSPGGINNANQVNGLQFSLPTTSGNLAVTDRTDGAVSYNDLVDVPTTVPLTSSKSVANAAARLALSLEAAQGYAVVDADTGKTWMLVEGGTPSVSGDWLQLGDRDIQWGDVGGKPSTFTPSSHTHPLSDLSQSAATSGQVATWNGSAWAPATPAAATVDNPTVNTAIATDPAASRAALRVITDSSQINAQSICAKRMMDWVFNGGSPAARPLMVSVIGDSYATGLALPNNCAVNGNWNLNLSAASGGATYGVIGYNYWINGMGNTFPIGSQADLTVGGQSGDGGYCYGDKCGIAYIKESGAGTFVLQAYSSVNASWSTIATIDCSNASTIGAYQEISLPTTNYPHYKLRVTSVTGGSVKVLFAGIWSSKAGGAMLWPHGALTGQSVTQVNSTPSAVFDPIWTGMKTDLVLACFQDPASEYVVGGPWRSFYAKAQALYAADWILVSPNPCGSTDTGINYATYDSADFQATITQQIDWARTSGETWVDGYSVFGSYAEAVAKGNMLVSDVAHLTTQGQNVRNTDIWRRTTFAALPLGGAAAFTFSPRGSNPAGPEPIRFTDRGIVINEPTVFRSTGSYCAVFDDQTNRFNFLKSWGVSSKNGILGFHYGDPNSAHFEVTGGYVNVKYGMMHRIRTISSSTTCTFADYTVLCNAASGNITLDVTSWPASYPGLIHVIKKTDSSANTVTIDPSSTPTIDGASNVVLTAQWQYIIIQSDGTNWVKIGGNI